MRLALKPWFAAVECERGQNPLCALRAALRVRIIDPACGDGSLLAAAVEYLAEQLAARFAGVPLPRLRKAIVRRCIYGIDVQPEAIAAARSRLLVLAEGETPTRRALARHLCVDDSLLMDVDTHWPHVAAVGGFDVVVGNPPFIDAETMTRTAPQRRAAYAARWTTARGNWDLSVPFVELSAAITRPGGHVSLVLPNKLLSARYADELRRHLRRFSLRSVMDCSGSAWFAEADVYPIVLHFQRTPPDAERTIAIYQGEEASQARSIAYSVFDALPDAAWHLLLSPRTEAYAEVWRRSAPLGAFSHVRGAATVAEAYEMAEAIVELPLGVEMTREHFRVVNTGTLRRYGHAWGTAPLRYLGRRYLRPVIHGAELNARWPRRADQSGAAKVIVGGLGKELRAFFDARAEYVAAKSTLVVTSTDIDPRLIAALLNSRWMSDAYRASFGGLALQGGYLQITVAHLRSLPFPLPQRLHECRSLVGDVCGLVDQIQCASHPGDYARLDRTIESAVMALVRETQCLSQNG